MTEAASIGVLINPNYPDMEGEPIRAALNVAMRWVGRLAKRKAPHEAGRSLSSHFVNQEKQAQNSAGR